MVTRVGVRELRDRLSYYLDRVRAGERICVTDRGIEIALISPSGENGERQALMRLVDAGLVTWNGRIPRFGDAIEVPGLPLSEIILEDRGEPV